MEGNTAWILISAAMVLFMVPGLALFYGGMVRTKNALNMLNMNMWCLGAVPVVWVLVGWSLASGDSGRSWLGDLSVVGLKGVHDVEGLATFAFLMTFACITPALISGAVADRMKFSAWMVFVPVWSLAVYAPVVYWVYGPKGWILDLPALDFAGGTAIHVNAGAAALALAIVLGKKIWLARKSSSAAQYSFRYVRRRYSLVWLVRIQCRVSAWSEWRCCTGICKHICSWGCRYGFLADCGGYKNW